MNFVDVAVGLCALVTVFVLSIFTGGFSFFAPWIFWGATVLFVAGFCRGNSQEEALWRSVVSINFCWLILVPALVRGIWWGVGLATLGTLVPTTAGVLARRSLARRRLNS
jgi:hypothetical protein